MGFTIVKNSPLPFLRNRQESRIPIGLQETRENWFQVKGINDIDIADKKRFVASKKISCEVECAAGPANGVFFMEERKGMDGILLECPELIRLVMSIYADCRNSLSCKKSQGSLKKRLSAYRDKRLGSAGGKGQEARTESRGKDETPHVNSSP
jgi:hypothetical protein